MTGKETEKRARLQAVLDAYGADAARWPERDRTELADLMAHDAGISQAVDDAGALDRLLDRATAPRAGDGAAARVLSTVSEDAEGAVVRLGAARRRDGGAAMVWRHMAWPAAGLM
ncbi:MAG: hypothetical protein ACR2PM_19375, partial [Hyphomicrobiales bacterium]